LENFTKLIPIEDGFAAQFFFNKTNAQTGLRCYISVIGKDKRPHFFVMEQAGDSWRISQSIRVPEWVMKVEKELSDVIIENTIQ
jgi:hypothetical protein